MGILLSELKKPLLLLLFCLPILAPETCAQGITGPGLPQEKPCKYPIHVSADALVKSVRQDFEKRTGKPPQIEEEDWKLYFYDNTRGLNFDTAYWHAQKFLIQKLGREVFCNYVEMSLHSFEINADNTNEFGLTFFLQLPNLENPKQQGYMQFKYEVLPLKFTFYPKADNSLSIIYPPFVPECNGLPDCGFKITKDKALALARSKNIITNNVDYFVETDGKDWIIKTSPDVGKTINLHRINLKTGELSEKQVFKQ